MDLSNTCINSSIHVPGTVSVPRRRHRTLLSSFLLSKPTGSRHTCIIQKSYNSTSGITALSQQIQRRRNTGSLGTTTSHTCTTAGVPQAVREPQLAIHVPQQLQIGRRLVRALIFSDVI